RIGREPRRYAALVALDHEPARGLADAAIGEGPGRHAPSLAIVVRTRQGAMHHDERSGETTRSELVAGSSSSTTRMPVLVTRYASPVGNRMCASTEEPQCPPRKY